MSSLGKTITWGSGRKRLLIIAAGVGAAAILLLSVIGISNGFLKNMAGVESPAGISAQNMPLQGQTPGSTPTDTAEIPIEEQPLANGAEPATDSPAEPQQPATPFEFTDDTFGILQSDPDKFAGSRATISGRVYSVLDQSSASFYMMTVKVFNRAETADESRAVILLTRPPGGASKPGIALEDCIAIDGKVRGGISEENSFGETIKVPLIDTASVSKMECIDSALPAGRTVDVGVSQSLNGVKLTAQRVQFAEGHTRVEIVAENVEGGDRVVIKEAVATQGGKSYQSTTHMTAFASYRLASKLVPESPATGYLFFEPVDNPDGEVAFRIVVEEVTVSDTIQSLFIFTVK